MLHAIVFAAALAAAPAAAPPPPPPPVDEATFLAANAKEPGVVTLPGPQYKVLHSGPATGETAWRQDDVTVRYEGRFPNGQLFDASPDGGKGTTVFPLKPLIPGWTAVLQLMRPGDVWMIYLPAYLAYGTRGAGADIPPNMPLVFKVELVSAVRHANPPAAK